MYATRDDMVAHFTELAISELESMHIDPSIATTKALTSASGKMDSYLSIRYQTPLAKTDNLNLVCCNIARYLLYMNDATGEPEDRYKEEIAWLKDVSAGRANVTFAEPLTADEQLILDLIEEDERLAEVGAIPRPAQYARVLWSAFHSTP